MKLWEQHLLELTKWKLMASKGMLSPQNIRKAKRLERLVNLKLGSTINPTKGKKIIDKGSWGLANKIKDRIGSKMDKLKQLKDSGKISKEKYDKAYNYLQNKYFSINVQATRSNQLQGDWTSDAIFRSQLGTSSKYKDIFSKKNLRKPDRPVYNFFNKD